MQKLLDALTGLSTLLGAHIGAAAALLKHLSSSWKGMDGAGGKVEDATSQALIAAFLENGKLIGGTLDKFFKSNKRISYLTAFNKHNELVLKQATLTLTLNATKSREDQGALIEESRETASEAQQQFEGFTRSLYADLRAKSDAIWPSRR